MTRRIAAAAPRALRARHVTVSSDGLERSRFRFHPGTPNGASPSAVVTAGALVEQTLHKLEEQHYRWSARSRHSEPGRVVPKRDALRHADALEQQAAAYFGATVPRGAQSSVGGLDAALLLLLDDLRAWVEFWQAQAAEHPAGFARDCPEPQPALDRPNGVDLTVPDPLPPPDRVAQLNAAPCAPPAGIAAS